MKNTFVIPDIHGRIGSLRRLLRAAGVIDDNDRRILGGEDVVVSVGDLLNGTLEDENNDLETLNTALNNDWIDIYLMGNHESGYLFDDMGFGGYYASPPLKSQYNRLYRSELIHPAYVVGDTLITHAGVHAWINFATAQDAYEGIMDAWRNYAEYESAWTEEGANPHTFSFTYERESVVIPKTLVINGVPAKRGGGLPFGGIQWSDWSEPKNKNFSQIMGHTPIKDGPVTIWHRGTDVVTINIDCGAKGGLTPTGVWLNDAGRVFDWVKADEPSPVLA